MTKTGTIAAIAFGALVAVSFTAAIAGPADEIIATTEGDLVIHPINHATFVMGWNGTTIYVDPVGGAERYAGFEKPDLILLTHIHGDHTSGDTLKTVSTSTTRLLAPASVAVKLGDTVPGELTILANGESFSDSGIGVEALPAYNLTEDRLGFHPKERGDNSYVVTLGGARVYISGDTEDIPEMRALEDIDAAFVCMNLPYTMTVEAAADAVLEFAPGVVFPYHYRGKGGMSDLEAFKKLVAVNPKIEVRLVDWYTD